MNMVPFVNRPAPYPWKPEMTAGIEAMFDPSDLSTMFQDVNGTTPAVPGDPVGLVLDKSGNGVNLSQPTAAARPTLMQDGENYYIQPDLTDDALTTTFPATIAGDILIAGRNGSIIEPFSGNTLTIGPTSYTGGTPWILSAIGGIVGVLVIDRNLTQVEKDQLIEYYKGKGTKGLLVPDGPELASDLFSLVPVANEVRSTLDVVGDEIVLTSTEIGTCFADIAIPNPGNVPIILQLDISSPSGRPAWMAGTNGARYTSPVTTEQYQHSSVVGQRNASWTLRFRLDSSIIGQQAFFKNVSLKELRPQEDWK